MQRWALLGGAAAALVAAPQKNNAAGLEQFKTLVDELAALNKAAQTGKATTKTLQKGFVTTVVPLENAVRCDPADQLSSLQPPFFNEGFGPNGGQTPNPPFF